MKRGSSVRAPLRSLIALLAIACAWLPASVGAQPPYPTLSPACAALKDSGDVHFRGLVLREIPDIDDPDLRELNVLMRTPECAAERDPIMSSFLEKHPGDYRFTYFNARLDLMRKPSYMVRPTLETHLQAHPEFASNKVLLASMHIEAGEFKEAMVLLDEVAKVSPHDLWAYVEQLVVEAALSPTSDTWRRAQEIANNAAFPPRAREIAAQIAAQNPASDQSPETVARRAQTKARPLSAECAAVRDFGDIHFRGQTLRETPDFKDPELRRLDVMLTTRCGEFNALLQDYIESHPDDYKVAFLKARMVLIGGDLKTAESMMSLALKQHPDFSAAKVLLASIYIAGVDAPPRIKEANALLDQLATESPHDLWAFLNRLKVEQTVAPSSDTFKKAEEILNSTAFPLTARDFVAYIVLDAPALSPDRLYATYQAWTTFEGLAPNWLKAEIIASKLIESDGQYAVGRRILVQALAKQRHPDLSVLLAESYLFEAAAIHPTLTAENKPLVEKALAAVNGDMTPVNDRMVRSVAPALAKLRPFVDLKTNFNAVDEYGRTAACNAVMTGDSDMLLSALAAGADPNGQCEGISLLEYPVRNGTDPPEVEQTIVSLLLEAGAKGDTPRIKALCQGDSDNFCKRRLLPILQRWGSRKQP